MQPVVVTRAQRCGVLRGVLVACATFTATPYVVLAQHQHGAHAQHGRGAAVAADDSARAVRMSSVEEVRALLAGEGMGQAKAAELNRLPGPKHVLELADSLKLTPAQRTAMDSLFRQMQRAAQAGGAEIVSAESKLDQLFARTPVDAAQAESLVRGIGMLRADVRWVHLRTHLAAVKLLDAKQVDTYVRLRGHATHEHGAHHAPE
jgi:Spy/CpxP family protein refolding chaperone